MNRNPKGCNNIGGEQAAKMEYCRDAAMNLFSLYGYHPFSPAEFQLIEDVWSKLSPARARRLIPVMTPLGEPCVLRGDLTLSAVDYLGAHHSVNDRPLRLSYADRVYLVPQPPKNNLEENQVGVELIGWEDSGADAETAVLLLRTLDLLSIENSVLVLGDVSVLASILDGLDESLAEQLTDVLTERNYTKYNSLLDSCDSLPANKKELLRRLPSLNGAPAILDEAAKLFDDPSVLTALKRLCDCLANLGYGDRLRVDLAFVRDLGYYSGPIYNAYSANGTLLGGGGRYDGLLIREGIGGQAAGFALNLKDLASQCASPNLPAAKIMLWGGNCDSAVALSYAEKLASRNVPFELSWTRNSEESISAAALRGYEYWVDLGAQSVTRVQSGSKLNLNDFEAEVFSC